MAEPHSGPLPALWFFMAFWITIGTGIGALFGAVAFDNVGLGISFGIPIGLAAWLAARHRQR